MENKEIKIKSNEIYKFAYIGDGENIQTFPKSWSNSEILDDYKEELKLGL